MRTIFKCLALFAAIGLSASLAAQELSVSYADGPCQVKNGAAWAPVNIGDKLAADAVVKLDKGASLEIQAGGSAIGFTRAGTYQLKDVLAARKKTDSGGVAKSLQSTLTAMAGAAPVRSQSSVAGVRAANKSESASNWVTSDTAVLVEAGKSLLQSGKYTDALARFLGAKEEAEDEELPQVQYLIAATLTIMGDERRAAKEVLDIVPDPEADWAGDCILLQAQLLEDSFAWTDAAALLGGAGDLLAKDPQRGPLYHFLLSLAWLNSGKAAEAKALLGKLAAQAPDSPIGQSAAALLKN
jgi:tetratricopeptide (TPR) repeat protein